MNNGPIPYAQLMEELTALRRNMADLEAGCRNAGGGLIGDLYCCTLFDENPMMLFIVDKEGLICSVNQFGAAELGYAKEELVGQPILNIFYVEDKEAVRGHMEQFVQEYPRVFFWEVRKVKKNGAVIWVKEFARSLKSREGALRIYIACEDITGRKQAEEALQESNSKLNAVLRASPAAIITLDSQGNVTLWNGAAEQMFGWSREEVIGRLNPIVPEDKYDEFQMLREKVLRGEAFCGLELRRLRKDGSFVDINLSTAPLRGAGGEVGGIMSVALDITERQRAVEELRKSEENYRSIFNAVYDAIFIHDLDGTILDVNRKMLEMYRIDRQKALTCRIREDFSAPDNPLEKVPGIWAKVIAGEDQMFEWKAKRPTDGSVFHAEVFLHKITFQTKDVILASVRDISARKEMEEEIMHMAHHDPLTDLPNRRLFVDILRLESAQARRHRTKMALLFLDLDRFKEVNDTLGHTIGDQLLKEVAVRLRAGVREADTISRAGGDEFNIILSDISKAEDMSDIAGKLVESFRRPFSIAGHDLYITTSIGISIYPDDSEDVDTLFRYADIAMYYAKEHGRNTFRFFNPAINIRSLERMRLESMLRQTVERGQLVVYYQPQVDIGTRRMVCAEAMVRWLHPESGLLEAKQFIPMAEDTGFITDIDEWMLRAVCDQVRLWREAGLTPLCVTVNLSAREFQNPELISTIACMLQETGTPPEYLDVEISETLAMSNIERTVSRLKELSKIGVHTSIDDFGTGYSSLNHLKRMPVEKLKIDRSFIQDIASDPDTRAVISAVTAMAHNMDMKVIAEGVETEAQLDFLLEAECDEAQGYFFSKPLPAEDLGELMTAIP